MIFFFQESYITKIVKVIIYGMAFFLKLPFKCSQMHPRIGVINWQIA